MLSSEFGHRYYYCWAIGYSHIQMFRFDVVKSLNFAGYGNFSGDLFTLIKFHTNQINSHVHRGTSTSVPAQPDVIILLINVHKFQ
jgi:hypothetical protein